MDPPDLDSFDFNFSLHIKWNQFTNSLADTQPFKNFYREGKFFYLIEKFNWKWKERYLIEEESDITILRPLQFPEPARIFIKSTHKDAKGFRLEYCIISMIEDRITVISTGYSKLRFFNNSSRDEPIHSTTTDLGKH